MHKKLICLVLFLCLFTGGCAAADGLTVTATFYPIYLAAINVCRGVEGDKRDLSRPAYGGLPARLPDHLHGAPHGWLIRT